MDIRFGLIQIQKSFAKWLNEVGCITYMRLYNVMWTIEPNIHEES